MPPTNRQHFYCFIKTNHLIETFELFVHTFNLNSFLTISDQRLHTYLVLGALLFQIFYAL